MLARLKDQVLRRITLTAKPTSISGYVEGRDVSYWPMAEATADGRGGRLLGSTRRRGGRGKLSMAAIASPASAIEASSAVAATKLGGSK
jgi:hypothetical protein